MAVLRCIGVKIWLLYEYKADLAGPKYRQKTGSALGGLKLPIAGLVVAIFWRPFDEASALLWPPNSLRPLTKEASRVTRDQNTEYEGEVDVPAAAIEIKDPAVVAKLPLGTQVTKITPHGASFGLEQPDSMLSTMGNSRDTFSRFAYLCLFTYNRPVTFSQTSYGDRGKRMMSGEFVAMSAIYNAVPDLAPRPIAWGTYQTIADVHFFLCDFHEMTDGLPDLETFPAKMAELHKSGNSPNGKFGFPVTTYHGNTAIEHGWSETWEEYFTATTKKLFELEQIAQGPNEDIRSLTEPFFAKVVPRLLRPLESGGRSIKPCLIHGDLWHGNATTDAETDLPIIFDAASSYARNECGCTTQSPYVSM
ncbi:MAG: hypothetical protein Q9211_000616 [Gyalolechia sp. 1 TL-2023]